MHRSVLLCFNCLLNRVGIWREVVNHLPGQPNCPSVVARVKLPESNLKAAINTGHVYTENISSQCVEFLTGDQAAIIVCHGSIRPDKSQQVNILPVKR